MDVKNNNYHIINEKMGAKQSSSIITDDEYLSFL
jgi:hypothetical protein